MLSKLFGLVALGVSTRDGPSGCPSIANHNVMGLNVSTSGQYCSLDDPDDEWAKTDAEKFEFFLHNTYQARRNRKYFEKKCESCGCMVYNPGHGEKNTDYLFNRSCQVWEPKSQAKAKADECEQYVRDFVKHDKGVERRARRKNRQN